MPGAGPPLDDLGFLRRGHDAYREAVPPGQGAGMATRVASISAAARSVSRRTLPDLGIKLRNRLPPRRSSETGCSATKSGDGAGGA